MHLGVTIDAEEAERLDLTLDIFEALGEEGRRCRAGMGWGLAVAGLSETGASRDPLAHRAGAPPAADDPGAPGKGALIGTARSNAARETRAFRLSRLLRAKLGTDTSYLACARALLKVPEQIYFRNFATHNAHTLAAVEAFAGTNRKFEFQRLFGMGEALYEFYDNAIRPDARGSWNPRFTRPVGSHEDLLAYLVRRLLEKRRQHILCEIGFANDKAPLEDMICRSGPRVFPAVTPKRKSPYRQAARDISGPAQFVRLPPQRSDDGRPHRFHNAARSGEQSRDILSDHRGAWSGPGRGKTGARSSQPPPRSRHRRRSRR